MVPRRRAGAIFSRALSSRAAICWFVGSLALPLAQGCANDSPTEGRELGGRVTDDFTGEALGGVDITFTSDTGFSAETRTGGGGRYEMVVQTDISFGQVRAQIEGYTPREQTVFFDADARRVDFELRPSL